MYPTTSSQGLSDNNHVVSFLVKVCRSSSLVSVLPPVPTSRSQVHPFCLNPILLHSWFVVDRVRWGVVTPWGSYNIVGRQCNWSSRRIFSSPRTPWTRSHSHPSNGVTRTETPRSLPRSPIGPWYSFWRSLVPPPPRGPMKKWGRQGRRKGKVEGRCI